MKETIFLLAALLVYIFIKIIFLKKKKPETMLLDMFVTSVEIMTAFVTV